MRAERDALRSALKLTAPAVDTRGSLKVLAGVHLVADGDSLTVEATDLDTTISHRIEIAGDGTKVEAVAPATVLRSVVEACGPGALELTVEGDVLEISGADGTEAQVDLMDADEWPDLPAIEGDVIEVSQALRDILLAATLAVSTDQARPVLMGVWLHADGVVSSADSYRGTYAETGETLADVTVPGALLRSVLNVAGDDLTMRTDGKRVHLTSNGTTWSVRCIDGDRPDVSRLIPAKVPHKITVARAELADAHAAVDAIGNSGSEITPVRWTADGDSLEVSRTQRGVGKVRRVIDAMGEIPEPIGLNNAHMKALCDAVHGDEVTIGVTDSSKPVVVVDGPTTHITMPVRGGAV